MGQTRFPCNIHSLWGTICSHPPADVSADRRSGTRQLRSCFSHSSFSISTAVINNVMEEMLHYTHIIAKGHNWMIFILHFFCQWGQMLHHIKGGFYTDCPSPLLWVNICTTQQQSPKQRESPCQTSNWYFLINSQLVSAAAKEPVLNQPLIKEGWQYKLFLSLNPIL